MARKTRQSIPGIAQHVVQRGHNRQQIFCSDEDRRTYFAQLSEAADHYGMLIHAWVFMTNHVHLLVTPKEADSVSRSFQSLGRNYVRYFNDTHGRSGTLYEGRYKSCLVVGDRYLLACYRYVEMNPVRAGMVVRPEDYIWSSHCENAFSRDTGLVTPHATYLGLGPSISARCQAYQALFEVAEDGIARSLRAATAKSLAIGSDSALRRLEAASGCRLLPKKPGPQARVSLENYDSDP